MRKCQRCNVELEFGQAIEPIEDLKYDPITPYSKGKLIRCLKCPKCGYSVTEDELFQTTVIR